MSPKAILYDLTFSLSEVNELANLVTRVLDPEEPCKPVDRHTLDRIISKLANAKRHNPEGQTNGGPT